MLWRKFGGGPRGNFPAVLRSQSWTRHVHYDRTPLGIVQSWFVTQPPVPNETTIERKHKYFSFSLFIIVCGHRDYLFPLKSMFISSSFLWCFPFIVSSFCFSSAMWCCSDSIGFVSFRNFDVTFLLSECSLLENHLQYRFLCIFQKIYQSQTNFNKQITSK